MMESGEDVNEKQIEKASGQDENEGKETLIVQKFRALLGFKSSKTRTPPSVFLSSAPSPSSTIEAEAPAPAPVSMPIQVHSHSPSHRSNSIPPVHKILEKHRDRGRFRRILAGVLVSAGAAFVVSVLGLFWVSGKFRKNKRTSARMMSVCKKKGGRTGGISKYIFSQKSASKVSLNPALDLLYLKSLERDLQQDNTCLKQTSEALDTFHERNESNQELIIKSEFDNGSSSSTREIMSVHEDVESIKYESDGAESFLEDKVIHIEGHSSDDESFHSFVDSHSSHIRLSNASASSICDITEISPSKVTKTSPSAPTTSSSTKLYIPRATSGCISTPALNLQPKFPQSPEILRTENLTVSSPSDSHQNFAPPTPPPPPPPPSLSTRITDKDSCSSPLPNLSSPRKSDSSSGSNQTPQNDLLSSPQKSPKTSRALSSIPSPPSPCPPPFPRGNSSSAKGPPPPPCPPPFLQGNSSSAKGPPPPPCPPPFIKGNSSSTKGPPPPPSQLPQYEQLGKDGTPLPKLKPLHWDKVRAAPDRSMVWDKIRSSSFEIDEEMIESLFGYNLQGTRKDDEAKSKTPSPSKHVLEPKRLQNLTILSKALNATPEQVCEALIRGDGLCLQQLEALKKMEPTKEEEAKLADYKGDINELGFAEKFVKVALTIPFAFLRVEAMLYRETFEDEVVHLRNSFSMLEEACKELRSSRLFLKLLEAVLKTGNRMNVGTIRGGARAFKLDALLKLSDVKGKDGKTTLLHFVVQEIIRSEGIRVSDSIMGRINQKNKSKTIEQKEEDYRRMGLELVSGLSTELYNVKKTATIDLDVLASSVSNLSEGMAKLQHLALKDLLADEKSGNFVHSMKIFIKYAERNLKELQEDEHRVLLHVREITEYFHGDVSKEEANPLRIFVIVRDFLGMLDHVCKELRSLKVPNSPNPLAPFR
ncbi:formin-like protein 11 isoform X2 [Hevea brasiliensis]|nr:formin-like protein 11 isoform X2 [Hevea brasiliensis]XP_021658692.2 formin-like protein 11 isoform X2 [Hevea brasiliensis]